MDATVQGVPERSRYEITLDGETVGFANYQLHDEVVLMPHTVVAPDHRGRGLAERLIRFALEDVRSQGRTVSPACSYVARFIEEQPDHADLLPR